MSKTKKRIIGCDVTVVTHTPGLSPHFPWKPQDIAKRVIAAADAGATSCLPTPIKAMEGMSKIMRENGTKPELEIYIVGH